MFKFSGLRVMSSGTNEWLRSWHKCSLQHLMQSFSLDRILPKLSLTRRQHCLGSVLARWRKLGTLSGVTWSFRGATWSLGNISLSLWIATSSMQMRRQCWATSPQNQAVPLTPAEVMTVEQKLKNGKATGDNIIVWLTQIINTMLVFAY